MKRVFVLCLICLFAVSFTGYLYAAGTADEAKAMVGKAAAFMKANGKEKAFAEINNTKGMFVKDDLYVWVSDLNAKMLAHGANEKLIGKSLIDLKDSEGKLFMKEMMDNAKANGTGWSDYKWTNPVTKKVEPKSTYFQKVDDMVFGCGIYKK
jgi:cytochrome c